MRIIAGAMGWPVWAYKYWWLFPLVGFRGVRYPGRARSFLRVGSELEEDSEMSTSRKIERSLFIEGREWFDKVNGNSYFSARIWVDGEQVAILPFQYGYGSQFEYEAQKKLLELGWLPQEGKNQHLWTIGQELGFDFYSSKTTTNKREMFKMYENYSEKVA